jgi:hypothetical protein
MGIIMIPIFFVMGVCGILGLTLFCRMASSSEIPPEPQIRKVGLFVTVGWAALFVGPFIVNTGGKVSLLGIMLFPMYALFALAVIAVTAQVFLGEKSSGTMRAFFISWLLLIGLVPVSWVLLGELFRAIFSIEWTY